MRVVAVVVVVVVVVVVNSRNTLSRYLLLTPFLGPIGLLKSFVGAINSECWVCLEGVFTTLYHVVLQFYYYLLLVITLFTTVYFILNICSLLSTT